MKSFSVLFVTLLGVSLSFSMDDAVKKKTEQYMAKYTAKYKNLSFNNKQYIAVCAERDGKREYILNNIGKDPHLTLENAQELLEVLNAPDLYEKLNRPDIEELMYQSENGGLYRDLKNVPVYYKDKQNSYKKPIDNSKSSRQNNEYKNLNHISNIIKSSTEKPELTEFTQTILKKKNNIFQKIKQYFWWLNQEEESSDEEEDSQEERSGVPTESSLKNKNQSQDQEI